MINGSGFSATSIDKIIDAVGVTKGSFFYHFKNKQDLALALIERFAQSDREVLESGMARAEKLSEDPLQQVLIFVGLMLEVAEELDRDPSPGCLFATYCFESGLFEPASHRVISDAFNKWTSRLLTKFEAARKIHGTTTDVDLKSLASMISVIFEGSFVMARVFPRQNTFAHQLEHYRRYVRFVFGA
jgi:TetR/AcrR family transcriptional repressor of nem operon